MNDTRATGDKTTDGESNAKRDDVPAEGGAQPRNTVSRIDSSTHENTPKTTGLKSGIAQTQQSSEQRQSGSGPAGGSGVPAHTRSGESSQSHGNVRLHGLRVAIVATDGFEIAELVKPRKALEEAGARTSVIAPKTAHCRGLITTRRVRRWVWMRS